MRFALLGNHPDGVEMACALVESGRHVVLAHTAQLTPEMRTRLGSPRLVADLEEVLADPGIEAVLVAGSPDYRPEQLRRALQSERHVLCVHPADQKPEIAYEAAMIRNDTGAVLFPLLTWSFHPALRRLASLLTVKEPAELGELCLLEVEWAAEGEVLEFLQFERMKPSFPGWDVLRLLGGEIAEVSGFAAGEELASGEPVLLAGRFARGGLFQMTLLAGQPTPQIRLTVRGSAGKAELLLPLGWIGPAFLSRGGDGDSQEEAWDRWDPWPTLVERFEAAVAKQGPEAPAWQDELRGLELDDAARRSVAKRRSSVLEYPEASEEVGFKGTMTLVGCGVLWVCLLLLVVARWLPQVGWVIVPLLVVFLGLQLLRYLISDKKEP